jgi:alpha-ketoglutarate-dependent taurine dioxygenase
MGNSALRERTKPALGGVTRKSLGASQTGWIRTRRLVDDDNQGPLVMSPAVDGLNLAAWTKTNRDFIESNLLNYGALLLRGFSAGEPHELEQFIQVLCGELLEYRERSSPRHLVQGRIYSSTDYPAHQEIFFHNENSYQHVWPMKIFFLCETPAQRGGETPIADTREVLRLLRDDTVERFARKGCMYVRNFDDQLGLPWQTVFQTEDRAAVESHCRAGDMAFEWKDGDRLRTRAVRRAVTTHPKTGQRVWFNHVAFFHVSTLEASIRDGLFRTMAEEDLPANTYYGDGSAIEAEVLAEIRDAYRGATVSFAWRQGDILLLDNMLTAHSRTPYEGERRILVGMSEPHGNDHVEAPLS